MISTSMEAAAVILAQKLKQTELLGFCCIFCAGFGLQKEFRNGKQNWEYFVGGWEY